jgi:hypothetical protein
MELKLPFSHNLKISFLPKDIADRRKNMTDYVTLDVAADSKRPENQSNADAHRWDSAEL